MCIRDRRKSLWRTRLEPTINIDNGWKIKNRIDYEQNYKAKGADKSHFYNRMLYLQGPAFGGTISLGKDVYKRQKLYYTLSYAFWQKIFYQRENFRAFFAMFFAFII